MYADVYARLNNGSYASVPHPYWGTIGVVQGPLRASTRRTTGIIECVRVLLVDNKEKYRPWQTISQDAGIR